MDESLSAVPASGPVADPAAAAIVVRQSRLQRDGLFGGLVAAFLVGLVRGYAGAQTLTGRIVLVVPLPFFSTKEVKRHCLGAGWSFPAGRRSRH